MQRRPNRAARGVVANLCNSKLGAVALVALSGLSLTGWRDLPAPWMPMPSAADPWAPVPHVRYRSTIEPYKRQRPVEPGPWREQNQRVTPQPRSGP